MGRFVVVVYRPKQGRDEELLATVKDHLRILRGQKLVTEREACVMRAKSGAIVEVFEWKSAESIAEAHANDAVKALWERFENVCDYTPLTDLEESHELFAEFDALEHTHVSKYQNAVQL